MFRPVCIATLAFGLCVVSGRAEETSVPERESDFAIANRAYAAGDYRGAREGYEAMIADGSQDPAVFLNLGHSNYRLGRDVEAAINYRRALALDPGNTAARSSLEHVMQKIGLPAPGLGFAEIVGRYIITFDWLVIVGSAAFWIGILFVLYGAFSPGRHNLWIAAGILMALFGATAAAISWAGDARIALARTLVVTGSAVARNAPADNSQKLCDLPPGTSVGFIASRGGWALVRLPLGVDGWVPEAVLTPIVPPSGQDREKRP